MGPGAIGRIGKEVLGLKADKVLFVTDKGVIGTGLIKLAQEALENSEIEYSVFDGVEPDPRYEIAVSCVEAIERLAKDLRVPKHLSEFGITEKDISGLAEGVMKVSRLLANNPRVINLEDAKEIYKSAL